MRKVLVTTDRLGPENIGALSKHGEVVEGWKMEDEEIAGVLPSVDAAIVLGWPAYFTRENLSKMSRLRLIQTVSVGVNQVRFGDLPARVTVCSNAGAYSTEVGEHAWGLLLAAAKEIPRTDAAIRGGGGNFETYRSGAKDTIVLKGKTMGIVAYGGIGRAVAKFARAFGMNVVALSRSPRREKGAKVYRGAKGLDIILKASDAVLLSIPLTKVTEGMIGARELGLMKKDAVLVNVSRGDIVEQRALYEHLTANPAFRYATDVWWYKDNRETLETEFPFTTLPNFIGTPHSSGPAGVGGGEPQRSAVKNTIRFLRGRRPKNVMDPSEYRGG
jgi:phosphoglycerate dehydrogenase-like enzyme